MYCKTGVIGNLQNSQENTRFSFLIKLQAEDKVVEIGKLQFDHIIFLGFSQENSKML